MIILVFETTGAYASAACIDERGDIMEEVSAGALSHLESLMPMTEALLSKKGITAKDVSCVAVSAGPGSFTGIRIGVSTARAFAQAMAIPCVAVPTLHTFLYNIRGFSGIACPILDARRDQVYGGAFSLTKSSGIEEYVFGGAYGIDEYLELLLKSFPEAGVKDLMFFGDGINKYRPEIEEWQRSSLKSDIRLEFAGAGGMFQKASSAAILALKLYNEGRIISYPELEPVYMRKAEAERKLEAGLLFL